jgi:nitrogenase iron protein NifH
VKQIGIYGKGGIGKSTIASNLAAAYAREGKKVLLVGCDPKGDTTQNVAGGRITPVLDLMRRGGKIKREEVLKEGYLGIHCVESGGPSPGVGCAGRGVITALELLKEMGILDDYDVVIYDVLGDVVCGGFAMPIRKGFAEEIYAVTSGEFMSLYAANRLCHGLEKLRARLGGIIYNSRGGPREKKLVREFAKRVGSGMIGHIPRSDLIQRAEMERKTVLEAFPDAKISKAFINLAMAIEKNEGASIPGHLSYDELHGMVRR